MGKIRLKVKEIAEEKGIENPFVLSQKTRIHYATCYRLWNSDEESEQRRIDLSTLEKLCDALKLSPGRFFHYEKD